MHRVAPDAPAVAARGARGSARAGRPRAPRARPPDDDHLGIGYILLFAGVLLCVGLTAGGYQGAARQDPLPELDSVDDAGDWFADPDAAINDAQGGELMPDPKQFVAVTGVETGD